MARVVYGTAQFFAVVNWVAATITAPLSVSKASVVSVSGNGISQFTFFGNGPDAFYTSINVVSINFVPDAQSVLSVTSGSTMTASDNFITYASFSGPAYGFTTIVLRAIFSQGSGIVVSGHSTVAFNNNVMSHSSAPTNTVNVVQLTLYEVTGGAIFSNSSLLITDGNTVVNTTFSTLVVVSVTFGTSSNLVLLDGSRASSDNNSIVNSSNLLFAIGSQTQVVNWSILYASLLVADGSHISLSSNSLRNVATTGMSGVYITTSAADISFLSGSAIAISNNFMWNVTGTTTVYNAEVASVYLDSSSSLNVTGGSTLEMHENGISCSIVSADYYSAKLFVNGGLLQLSDRSIISLKNNFAKTSVFGSSVYIAFYSIRSASPGQVLADSSFQMSANRIESSQVNMGVVVCTWGGANVIINSTVDMSGNSMLNTTVNYLSSVVYWPPLFDRTAFRMSSSHFNFNDNSLINTSIYALAYVVNVAANELFLAQNLTINVLRSTVNSTKAIQLVLGYISMTNAFTVDAGSSVNVNSNNVSIPSSSSSFPTSNILVALLTLNIISLAGALNVVDNTVWSRTVVIQPYFQLINANSFSAVGTSSVVLTCNNTLSWDSNGCNYPKPYLVPALLASSAELCVPTVPSNSGGNPSKAALIAGVVVGVIVGILLLIGVTLFLRRRFMSNPSSDDKHLGAYAAVQ